MSFTVDGIAGLLDVISAGTWWLQVHTGPPGAAGTANVAGTRAPVHFGAPTTVAPQHVASDGTATADGVAVNFGTWVGAVFPLNDFITHWTLWNAATAGVCWAKGVFGGLQPRVAFVSGATFSTPTAHGFAAGDVVELAGLVGLPLDANFDPDAVYAVTTAGLTATGFSVSTTDESGAAVSASAPAACIVQKIVPVLVNTDDPVRVAAGEIILYVE